MINLWRGIFLDETDLMGGASVTKLAYLNLNRHAFLWYVIRERMLLMLLMVFLGTTYIGGIAVIIFLLWTGMSVGIVLSAAAIRYGVKGLLLTVVGVFPQYLLLVPACILLLRWCEQTYLGIYDRSLRWNPSIQRRSYLLKRSPQLILILMLAIGGCIMEAYVNPNLVTGLLRLIW